ncbi:SGNH/GDSL hydrolase family protein [Verrucomicrobiaceae bacterium 227]
MKLILLIALPASTLAQTLYDLAPDQIGNESLPLTYTVGLNLGYDSNPQVSRKFYFFGDSLTDTGNLGRLIGGLGAGYPGFTLSNGPTWPSYLDPSVVGFSEIDENPALASPARSVDFAIALSTTHTIAASQTGPPFLDFRSNLTITPNDLAFIWGGANDFLPLTRQIPAASPDQVATTIETGTTNLVTAVSNLENQGLRNFAVISMIDLSLAPGVSGFDGGSLAKQFNTTLQQKLTQLPTSPRLLWIDANAFINDAASHPSAYGLTNVTESIAFDAADGIPSTLSLEEQEGYLFYDHIHPSTTVHQQFAAFVASHLRLKNDATDAFLVTDALLGLDDRSGFETRALKASQFDFNISTSSSENHLGQHRRSTQNYRADLDYALTDHLIIGVEALYTDGESGPSNFESVGIGLDALLHGSSGPFLWEAGLGLGFLNGELDRDYQTGTLTASSEHEASLFTLHAALRRESFTLGGLPAYWELGLKHRFAHRSGSRESGAASLDLAYQSETLSTTLANLELGLHLSSKFLLEFSLNPVLAHHGGEISASQTNGFHPFSTSDQSGYDTDTARTTLIYSPSEYSNLSAGLLIGTDDTWSAHLGYGIRF